MRRGFLLLGLLGMLGLVGVLGPVSSSLATLPSTAYVYWANNDSNTIGRANLDGTNVDQSFISGASNPAGVAVDAGHVYWTNETGGTIGRANLDGTNVDQSFISGANQPIELAVDAGHIYWTNQTTGSIGRANLDGTNVDQSYISGASYPAGVALDAGHVYWANYELAGTPISRANLDGTNVDKYFISGASSPWGVAVDAGHVYWVNTDTATIGRANLDGTNADQSFITGANNPGGVAVDPGHVYWTNANDTIGRANLDGTGANQSFISTDFEDYPLGVAVTPSAVTPPRSLHSGATSCNGTYSGTGSKVVVRAGATCTLVPGTHVKNSVVVRPGGTLHVNGVKIGGDLLMSGSATVCGSRIGRDVVATGGSFALGGPGCAGNKIAGNTSVTNDANDVWVWGNTTLDGLTVKNVTGAIDSIVGNRVFGGLLVAHSGPPVEVSGNHAYTASCVNNTGQTGSGNHAHGTNTCPR